MKCEDAALFSHERRVNIVSQSLIMAVKEIFCIDLAGALRGLGWGGIFSDFLLH